MWILLAATLLPLVAPQYMVGVGEERGWHVNKYPNPWYRWTDCNRDNRSAICDPDSVISKKDADEIDRLIMAVNSDTRCPCYHCVTNQKGYVIRVALMEDMQPLIEESEDVMGQLKNVRLFSYLLTQRWKLTGQCNETLLIVYSRTDNVLYTLTGSQAQKLLNDDLIVEISVDVRPFFDERETIADGLKAMIIRYRDVFKKTYDRKKAVGTPYEGPNRRPNSAGLTELSPFLIISMVTMLLT